MKTQRFKELNKPKIKKHEHNYTKSHIIRLLNTSHRDKFKSNQGNLHITYRRGWQQIPCQK